MSYRVLKKLGLQGEKDLSVLADDASDTEADFSSSGGAKKKQLNLNRYDLVSVPILLRVDFINMRYEGNN